METICIFASNLKENIATSKILKKMESLLVMVKLMDMPIKNMKLNQIIQF